MSHQSAADEFWDKFCRWSAGELHVPWLEDLYGWDGRFPCLTGPTIQAALIDFPLPLLRSAEWLALMAGRALARVTPKCSGMPANRPGSAEVRLNLRALACEARALADKISHLDDFTAAPVTKDMDDDELVLFRASLVNLRLLAERFERAAESLEVKAGPWRSSEARKLRVLQARSLAPIYEMAFGAASTVNDRPDAPSLGPWPEFFAHTLALATGEKLTRDQVRDVLKQARKAHVADPLLLPVAMISKG